MIVKFYRSKADPRKVDKSSQIELLNEIDCVFKNDDMSIYAPYIECEYNPIQSNYASITTNDFTMYYFIDDIEVLRGGIYRVKMSLDVLMTYRYKILETTQLVSRQENKKSPYQTDSAIPIQSRKEIKTIEFSGGDLNIESATTNTNNFVLMVAGGRSKISPTPTPTQINI